MLLLKARKQQTANTVINTPLQLLRFMCAVTRGIKYIGGTK